jgi:predicted aspartyl protease
LVSVCLSNLPSGLGQEPFQVKFRVVKDMIIVPVTINGVGPFDFLVDTGSTDTVIDRKLAEELHLLSAGKMTVETAEGEAVTPLVQTDSLSMGGATVRGLSLGVVNHYADLLPKVRGSLGEDFLRTFDLLIDNRRHLIHFEFGAGSLADKLTGEHLPVSVNGSYEQELTRNRLVVVGRIFELGNKNVKLQLDSGTPSIVLFTTLNTSTLVSGESSSYSLVGILGRGSLVDPQTARFLRLGEKVFGDLTIFVPRAKIPIMDVDGLLPTALFRSIFISHSGKFVILDPSIDPALGRSKPAPHPDADIPVVRSLQTESRE